jgi:mRNA-degrading endonuclease RelE of RelBE toxin-antitoxin system
MSVNKHPWEYKQPTKVEKTTKEEFENLLKKVQEREDSYKSDLFIKEGDSKKPKSKSSPYRMINGVPHKMTAEGWVPLKKI